jgi:hypothetical protein
MTDEEWQRAIYQEKPKLPERAKWSVPLTRPAALEKSTE